jgi:hypothetical protein
MRSFSAVENRRRRAFAETSVVFAITVIVAHSLIALDTDLSGGRGLSYVGREGIGEIAVCHRSSVDRGFNEAADLRRQIDRSSIGAIPMDRSTLQ